MQIGELAKRAGASTPRIRFYEAKGLLEPAPRPENGYRDYGETALRVLTFIAKAQGLGFTLRDISIHLRSQADKGRKAGVLARLEAKLAELDAHLDEIRQRRATLLQLLAQIRDERVS